MFYDMWLFFNMDETQWLYYAQPFTVFLNNIFNVVHDAVTLLFDIFQNVEKTFNKPWTWYK